jgi:hypothetical protein
VSIDRHDYVIAKRSPSATDATVVVTRADAAKRRQLADRVRSRTIEAETQAAVRVRSAGWSRT